MLLLELLSNTSLLF